MTLALPMKQDAGFWAGKRVLVTGHTGFKGAWLAAWLLADGAQLMGLSLAPEAGPSLYEQTGLRHRMDETIGDMRDPAVPAQLVDRFRPDVVFHLAAQSLVRRSYRDPLGTWNTNVMGSANLLAAVSALDHPCAVVFVTTDKVYENLEWVHPYRENDRLGGKDPYAASKAANELLVSSWRTSFLGGGGGGVRVATARAGNVIGGGDWAEDRIIPDLVRARQSNHPLANHPLANHPLANHPQANHPLQIRNPHATRPWQHVLEPLSGYRLLAQRLYLEDDLALQSAFNFGPDSSGQRSVLALLTAAEAHWPGGWEDVGARGQPHEASLLALTIDKARHVLGWSPRWGFETAVAHTMQWYRAAFQGADCARLVADQIAQYEAAA